MAIERVGTLANTQIMLSHVMRAESALNKTNKQVASGYVSDTYTGYGNKIATLEAARSAAARAEAHIAIAQQAASRLDLQDTQLQQLSAIAGRVRQALTRAVASDDSSALMLQLQDLFDQAVTVLNAKDGSGYIYGGDNDQTPPITVATLADLAALPAASDAFANGTTERQLRIGENRTIQVGLLASDLGTELFTLFRDIAQFDQGVDGPFTGQLTPAQDNFLSSKIQDAATAYAGVNSIMAANGDRYRVVQDTILELQATATVYKTFVGNIQDVDMGEALARLNQNQVALQAAFHVASTLNQLSLLNYLR